MVENDDSSSAVASDYKSEKHLLIALGKLRQPWFIYEIERQGLSLVFWFYESNRYLAERWHKQKECHRKNVAKYRSKFR